jgi:hypothetical protein
MSGAEALIIGRVNAPKLCIVERLQTLLSTVGFWATLSTLNFLLALSEAKHACTVSHNALF